MPRSLESPCDQLHINRHCRNVRRVPLVRNATDEPLTAALDLKGTRSRTLLPGAVTEISQWAVNGHRIQALFANGSLLLVPDGTHELDRAYEADQTHEPDRVVEEEASMPAVHAELGGNGAAPIPPSPSPKAARKRKGRRKARNAEAMAAARARFWHRGMQTIPIAADEPPKEDQVTPPKTANNRAGKAVTFTHLANEASQTDTYLSAPAVAPPETAPPAPTNGTAAANPVIDHAEQRLALATRILALTERVMDLLV